MRRRRFPLLALAVAALGLGLAPAALADAGRPAIAVTDLGNAGRPCATAGDQPASTGYFAGELYAIATAEGATTAGTYRFAIWAVGDKAHATALTAQTDDADRAAHVSVPSAVLQDGSRYAWHVRFAGQAGRSAWSATCLFTYDVTRPATPTITPTNFPDPQTAPTGRLADFHLGSAGSSDVVGYQYVWNNELPVPGCSYSGAQGQLVCDDPLAGPDILRSTADGGDADVQLSPPWWGSNRLIVRSIDAAGNVSLTTEYDLYVAGSGPTITVVGAGPTCGPSVRLRFTPDPHVSGVTAYTYTIANGPPRTVRAGRSGSAAVTVPLARFGTTLSVRSHSADGYDSTDSDDYLRPDPAPLVFGDVYTEDAGPEGGVGQPGTFDVYPPQDFDPAVDTLTYRFSDGTTGTVPADDSTVLWTPAAAGPVDLVVTASDAAGRPLGCGETYSFVVAG